LAKNHICQEEFMVSTSNLKRKTEELAKELKHTGKELKEELTEDVKTKGQQLKKSVKDFAKEHLPGDKGQEMKSGSGSTMPKRDITGDCEGECRDRVKEGESERQDAIESDTVKAADESPKAPGAGKRNDPPGSMGGKV
jgi:hypothetical protein